MRPVVIAHRGASGHLPEHTLPAKALAYAMGADYLEQDVVATHDDALVGSRTSRVASPDGSGQMAVTTSGILI